MIFEADTYQELQQLQQGSDQSLSLLVASLVVEALEARKAGTDEATAVDHLKQALNLLDR